MLSIWFYIENLEFYYKSQNFDFFTEIFQIGKKYYTILYRISGNCTSEQKIYV